MKKKKTVKTLDVFIRMVMLGLMSNMRPEMRKLGNLIKKNYEETFGEIETEK